jgi:hypothetical protein
MDPKTDQKRKKHPEDFNRAPTDEPVDGTNGVDRDAPVDAENGSPASSPDRDEQRARIALLVAQAQRETRANAWHGKEQAAKIGLLEAQTNKERKESGWFGRANLNGFLTGLGTGIGFVLAVLNPLMREGMEHEVQSEHLENQRAAIEHLQDTALVDEQRRLLRADNEQLTKDKASVEQQRLQLEEELDESNRNRSELTRTLKEKALLAERLGQENQQTKQHYLAVAEKANARVAELERLAATAAAEKLAAEQAEASKPSTIAPARPFDRQSAENQVAEAKLRATRCAETGPTRGDGSVRVTIEPWGRVARVTHLNEAFVGTPVGLCVIQAFQQIHVPPFDVDSVGLVATFSVR